MEHGVPQGGQATLQLTCSLPGPPPQLPRNLLHSFLFCWVPHPWAPFTPSSPAPLIFSKDCISQGEAANPLRSFPKQRRCGDILKAGAILEVVTILGTCDPVTLWIAATHKGMPLSQDGTIWPLYGKSVQQIVCFPFQKKRSPFGKRGSLQKVCFVLCCPRVCTILGVAIILEYGVGRCCLILYTCSR